MVAELQIQNREASVGSCRGDAEKMTKLFLSSRESPKLYPSRFLSGSEAVHFRSSSNWQWSYGYKKIFIPDAGELLARSPHQPFSFILGWQSKADATRTWSGTDDIESKEPSSTEGEHLYWIKKIGKLGKIKRKSSGQSRSKSISINRPTSPEIQRPFPTIPIKPRLNRKLYFSRQT